LVVVGVADAEDETAPVAAVVVVVGAAGGDGVCWGGGTSVDALQIWAYEGVTAGGGSLGLAGSLDWNRSPSTSSEGFEADCSVGPLLAYTQDPDDPCQ
jgi:hypothetical protein